MKPQKIWLQSMAVLIILAVFFILLFYLDNKYQTPPPYGKAGIITLNGQDLERDTPIFLIDGWLFHDERTMGMATYIGEFSNLQRGEMGVSPHGRACYQLTLRYDGMPQIVSVDFPLLSFEYAVRVDGVLLAEGGRQRTNYVPANAWGSCSDSGNFIKNGVLQRNVFSAGAGNRRNDSGCEPDSGIGLCPGFSASAGFGSIYPFSVADRR